MAAGGYGLFKDFCHFYRARAERVGEHDVYHIRAGDRFGQYLFYPPLPAEPRFLQCSR